MDEVRNTITQVLNDTANHEILVLNIPMDSFAAFCADLQALLTLIHSKTTKVFVPISLTQSPIAADKFIIVFRTSENVQAFSLDGWFTENIASLAKKFVTKTLKLENFQPSTYNIRLTQILRQFNASESLNLIGGF